LNQFILNKHLIICVQNFIYKCILIMSKLKKKNNYITDVKDIITNINNTINKNDNLNENIDKPKNTIVNNTNFISHTKNKNKNIFDKNEELYNEDNIFSNIEINNINQIVKGDLITEKDNTDITNKKNDLKVNTNLSSSSSSEKNLKLKANSSNSDNLEKKPRNCSSSLSSPNSKISSKKNDKNQYFNELLKKQITGISSDKKLNYNDLKRISKFIKSSIFDKKKCSIWDGYITNENNNSKGTYINFYFNKKKIALHRLLYINYKENLLDSEYLKFSCENRGKCCNINHMKKYSYNKKINSDKTQNDNKDKDKKNNTLNNDVVEPIQINLDKKKLIVEI